MEKFWRLRLYSQLKHYIYITSAVNIPLSWFATADEAQTAMIGTQ